jgi:hypothetical protein
VVPLDLLIVRRVEEIDVRRHVVASVVVHVLDETALPREADDGRQKCLRHAVRDVRPIRIAPLGDDVAVMRDETAGRTAILDRPDQAEERLLAEVVRQELRHVVRPRRVVGNGQLHGFVHERSVHAGFFRLLVLPVEALRKVRAGRRRDDPSLRRRRREDAVLRESRHDDERGKNERKCASQHGVSPCEAAV